MGAFGDNHLIPPDPTYCPECWQEDHPGEEEPYGVPQLCYKHEERERAVAAEFEYDSRKEEGLL